MPKPFSRFGCIAARLPLVGPRQRIGLLGGSFDPPHAAHVLISDIAQRRLGLDRVWWLVTPGNPLKSARPVTPMAHRVALCRDIVGQRSIVVTDFERALPSPFTAATLDYLLQRAAGVHFVWIMGADGLAQFHRWREWRRILEAVPVAVVDRPGWRHRALASKAALAMRGRRLPESRARELPYAHPPAWTLLSGPLSPLSSTDLRRIAASGALTVGNLATEP